ncbi:leucine-rich repeat-containing protein 23-like isoform X2 [Tubulanus polymorphus]|uniref:leucine-rich repeat-containing protein 23-like isoform X2 n=1 Tax=Tubulanus polymorphus TaxID=672921 RepID=UPI003DA38422
MSDQEEETVTGTEEEEAAVEEQQEEVEEEGEEEEKVEEEEEEEEKIPENPLTPEMVAESLTLLCKIGDGLSHAYVRVDLHDRELSDIKILEKYIHLRFVDVSRNRLKDISSLNSLTHLLTLKADENLLTTAQLEEMPYLQVASFNNNKIMSTEGITHPLIEQISLNFNEIKKVEYLDGDKLARLHTLELRGNKLETTDGIFLPNLRNLFLAQNTIKTIEGMEHLTHLTTLHLRENQIEKLDGFTDSLVNLQYINLRGNNITDVKETQKLQCLPMLRALALSENPISEEDDYRMEVLIALRKLERLDKDEYTDDERQEAEDIYEQRRAEQLAAESIFLPP